jgi:TPR repeat protein
MLKISSYTKLFTPSADHQTILKKKAKQGNAESQYTLGTMYELGEGVAEDDKEAFKWFSLAPTT